MTRPQLRPYQKDVQNRVYERWRSGDRVVCATLPCGAGKSVIAADTIRQFADAGKTVLVMAHVKEITGQLSLHLGRQEVRHRLISPNNVIRDVTSEHRRELSGRAFINPSSRIAVGSMQTLVSRMNELTPWMKTVDLVVADEFHHTTKGSGWGKVFDACPNAIGLGMTATPLRADGKGLGSHNDGYADSMVLGPTMRELIEMGNLTEYEILAPPSDFSLDDLKKGVDGDYTVASMKAASDRSHLVGDIVEHYIKHALNRRAIVFATDVETSIKIAAQFNSAGVPAMAISGNTDPSVRMDAMRRLKDGRLMVLTNCSVYGEGTDIENVDVAIFARPTASYAMYVQQFGRPMRPNPNDPGKVALIIDHCSNVRRHGFPDQPRTWSLERRDKRGPKAADPELIKVLICENTGRPYQAIDIANCPHCHESHVKVSDGSSNRVVETVAGDLTRLTPEDLAILRAATVLPSPDDAAARGMFAGGPAAAAGQRAIALSRIQAQRELSDALADWGGVQRHKHGRDDSELHRRFYHATGVDVLTALAGSRAEMVALTERIRGWMQ